VFHQLAASPIGRTLLMPYRYWTARRYLQPDRKRLRKWALTSREHTNFTYDLADLNVRYLACFVAEITGCPVVEIDGYLAELGADTALRDHIREATRRSPFRHLADDEPRFGRRAGWYAIARAVKPSVIVETGVDKGLGACVLSAALLKNAADGHGGRYFGTDINPRAGYLLGDRYATVGQVLVGDSIESLQQLGETVDMFINDSDHSAAYEGREYETIESKLSERGIVIGDNAHTNDELLKFAARTNRTFLFFAEDPKDHWYPGGGIGAAFTRSDHA
jgi:Methyltransferase domain